MLTFEELDRKVTEDLEEEGYADFLKEWNDKKRLLLPHPESYPIWETAEDGTDYIADYGQEMCEGFATYNDELAWVCEIYGCSVSYTQDYWDGSPTYYIGMPRTEEEYQENIARAKKEGY